MSEIFYLKTSKSSKTQWVKTVDLVKKEGRLVSLP